METEVITAVVLREGSTLRAYSYPPGEIIPTSALCMATVEYKNGKYDKGRLRKELVAAAKRANIVTGDIRDLGLL